MVFLTSSVLGNLDRDCISYDFGDSSVAIQYRLGQFLGSVAFNNLKSRRKTTIRNMEVCFLNGRQEQLKANARQVFIDPNDSYF